jgi:nicotinate-nucleotide--dimethylbenzimidazole phosphoribosyltransferase
VNRGDLLERTTASISPTDRAVAAQTARLLDAKTKPPGSLGRLEELACRLAAILGRVPDGPLRPAIVVAAADHGVAARGVSAYPNVVTAQMLANFAGGGAAICVLARAAGAGLVVVDAGVIGVDAGVNGHIAVVDGVRTEVVDGVRCSDDLTMGPAMSRSTATGMIERGIALAEELAAEGVQILGLGEMGIANTTSASALTAALLPAEPSLVCGPGTGIDDAGLARKVDAVRRGLAANGLPRPDADPVDVLSAVGGLEIAFLVGVTLGAAARRIPVLLDGFVSSVAALVAYGFREATAASFVAATRSPEPGHALVLERLGLEPLLDLGLRLGEGTGAALALPLVRSSIAILTDMATFDAAGVSGPAPGVETRSAAGDA